MVFIILCVLVQHKLILVCFFTICHIKTSWQVSGAYVVSGGFSNVLDHMNIYTIKAIWSNAFQLPLDKLKTFSALALSTCDWLDKSILIPDEY